MTDVEKVKKAIKSQLEFHKIEGTSHCYNEIVLDDALKVIESQQAEIERLHPKWIPVSENPMAWFNKLVSFKYKGETYFGEGYWSGAKWVVTGFPNNKFPNGIEVTHWMQPPELPKDGEQNG